MKYAVVSKNLVENLILWDGEDESFAAAFKKKQLVPVTDDAVSIGWKFADGVFAAPASTAEPTAETPRVVSMRQAQLALLAAGLYQSVEDAFAAAAAAGDEGMKALIEWRTAATVERDSPVVADLAKALKLKAVDLDALFLAASQL